MTESVQITEKRESPLVDAPGPQDDPRAPAAFAPARPGLLHTRSGAGGLVRRTPVAAATDAQAIPTLTPDRAGSRVIRRFAQGDGPGMQALYGFRSAWVVNSPTLSDIFTTDVAAISLIVTKAAHCAPFRQFLMGALVVEDDADMRLRWDALRRLNAALGSSAIQVTTAPSVYPTTVALGALAGRVEAVAAPHRTALGMAGAAALDYAVLGAALGVMEDPGNAGELSLPAALDLARASGNVTLNPNLRIPGRRQELAAALVAHPVNSNYPRGLPWGNGQYGSPEENVREHTRKHAMLGDERDLTEPMRWWIHLGRYAIDAGMFAGAPPTAFDPGTHRVTDATAAEFFAWLRASHAAQDLLLPTAQPLYRAAVLTAAGSLSQVMVTAGGDKVFMAGQETAHGIFVVAAWTPAGFTLSSGYFNTTKIASEARQKVWNLA